MVMQFVYRRCTANPATTQGSSVTNSEHHRMDTKMHENVKYWEFSPFNLSGDNLKLFNFCSKSTLFHIVDWV